MDIKSVKISNLHQSPVRNQILPTGFIQRVIAYKKILSDVETSSLELTVCNFLRDANPESELNIWEKIAEAYQSFITENNIIDLDAKKTVLGDILYASMGGAIEK